MTHKTLLAPHKPLSVVTVTELDVLVISVVGIADSRTADRLYSEMRSATCAPTGVLVLDLHQLQSTDRASMRVLATEVQSVRNRGIPVALVGLDRPGSNDWPIEDVAIPVQFATVPLAIAALASTSVCAGDPRSATHGRTRKAIQLVGHYVNRSHRVAHPSLGVPQRSSGAPSPRDAGELPRRIDSAPSWRAPTPNGTDDAI